MVGAFFMLGEIRAFILHILGRWPLVANRIKDITVEISGDTTKLQNALKGVNGQIRNTQSAHGTMWD